MATGTTLTDLITALLSDLDLYNANDVSTSTVGTSGYQAMRAINKALQKLYSKLQDAYFLKKVTVNATLSSTAAQDYVDLSSITDMDEIEDIYIASIDRHLKPITFEEYRRRAADPAESTGDPIAYHRRDTYLYLSPRPDAIYNLSIWYTKLLADLSTGSGTTVIPSKFDYLILAWAKVEWQLMEDPNDQVKLEEFKADAKDSYEIAHENIFSKFGVYEESDSYWDQDSLPAAPPFDSPVGS